MEVFESSPIPQEEPEQKSTTNNKDKQVSRRDFLKLAGKAAIGAAVAGEILSAEPAEAKTRLEETIEKWPRYETLELNGKKIEVIGVAHHTKLLEKSGNDLEAAVERASVVVLEGLPSASGILSEKTVSFIRGMLEKEGKDLSKFSNEQIIEKIKEEPSVNFFYTMEQMAHKANKKVATVDPLSLESERTVIIEAQEKIEQSNKVKNLLLGLGGLSGIAIAKAMESAESDGEEMSRRSAMAHLIKMGSAFITVYNILKLFGKKIPELSPTLIDYRDAAVAKGIKSLSEKELGEGPIVVIYGGTHMKPVKNNIEQLQRGRELPSHKSYKALAEPKLRVYEPREGGMWKMIQEQSLDWS